MDIQELSERVDWLMGLKDDEIDSINYRLKEIEDRLDQIQKKGKYRDPGPFHHTCLVNQNRKNGFIEQHK